MEFRNNRGKKDTIKRRKLNKGQLTLIHLKDIKFTNYPARKKKKYTLGMKMGYNHRWNRDMKAMKAVLSSIPMNFRT